LLEHVSDLDLARSRSHGTRLATYHTKLFYEFEGQRAALADEIRTALQFVPSISVAVDDWCRQVKTIYALSPLSCAGSLISSGRFNYGNDLDTRFPRFPALYIAENRATAHCEMFQIPAAVSGKLSAEEMNFQPNQSISAYALTGTVHQVFDLTRPENLTPFLEVTKGFALSSELRKMEKAFALPPRQVVQTPEQLMSTIKDPDWRAYPMYADVPANGQVLGSLLQDAGFEAILYDSVRLGGGRAMAVFPRNFLNSTSSVRVLGAPTEARCTVLNAENSKEIAGT
jgi:RES domain